MLKGHSNFGIKYHKNVSYIDLDAVRFIKTVSITHLLLSCTR